MTSELPADIRALYREIARASLIYSFRQAFGEEPPDYTINNPQEVKQAEREWRRNYAREITLLAIVAQQALGYLDQRGHQVALASFTSSVITQPELDRFMSNNPYLTELVARTCRDAGQFRALLALLSELKS
ncbi:MAG TPA: hypothetical protein VFH06_04095 [Candidatus Saccharimonadales bacterium]|nr:hypothetical protein [Candidatus Saccharimonadales bacterium]